MMSMDLDASSVSEGKVPTGNGGVGFTPGPWQQSHRKRRDGMYATEVYDAKGSTIATVDWYPVSLPGGVIATARAPNARLIAAAPDMLAALNAAAGYLLNAKIDIETGAPRRTAVRTIEGGLKLVREAVAKATSPPQGNAESPSTSDLNATSGISRPPTSALSVKET